METRYPVSHLGTKIPDLYGLYFGFYLKSAKLKKYIFKTFPLAEMVLCVCGIKLLVPCYGFDLLGRKSNTHTHTHTMNTYTHNNKIKQFKVMIGNVIKCQPSAGHGDTDP